VDELLHCMVRTDEVFRHAPVDRVSFAMIVMLPVMQLVLFGFAITHHARTICRPPCCCRRRAISPLDPQSDGEHRLFPLHHEVHTVAEFGRSLKSGKVLFGVEIPRRL